jgi:hypothetical protein
MHERKSKEKTRIKRGEEEGKRAREEKKQSQLNRPHRAVFS